MLRGEDKEEDRRVAGVARRDEMVGPSLQHLHGLGVTYL